MCFLDSWLWKLIIYIDIILRLLLLLNFVLHWYNFECLIENGLLIYHFWIQRNRPFSLPCILIFELFEILICSFLVKLHLLNRNLSFLLAAASEFIINYICKTYNTNLSPGFLALNLSYCLQLLYNGLWDSWKHMKILYNHSVLQIFHAHWIKAFKVHLLFHIKLHVRFVIHNT